MKTSAHNSPSSLTLRANFCWTLVGNVINASSWFAMTIVLAKLGSPEHVGQFALGLAVTAPIFMFATLRLRDVQATDATQEYTFGDYFALRLITTALALLAVVAVVSVSGYEWELGLIILATAASKGIAAVDDTFYGLFMQHERLDRIAKSMMMEGPLSLFSLTLGFYLTGSVFWGVVGLAAARTVIFLGYDFRNATLTLNVVSRRLSDSMPKSLLWPHWNATILARLAWMVLPLGFVTMLISLNSNIPRYFIEAHLGAYQLGIFAAITSFQKTAPTVVQALGRSASPRLAKYYTTNNAAGFRRLTHRLISIGVLLGGAGIFVAGIAGQQILTLFYGPEYALSGLFLLVMIAAGTDYVATMLLFVITSARYFRVQLPLHLATTGTVAVASFWLIPATGLSGAVTALIIGNLVRLGGAWIAAWHAQRVLYRCSVMPGN